MRLVCNVCGSETELDPPFGGEIYTFIPGATEQVLGTTCPGCLAWATDIRNAKMPWLKRDYVPAWAEEDEDDG